MNGITAQIAAVVVLYNPDPGLANNLRSFSFQVDKVYAIDNSVQPHPTSIETASLFPNIDYLALQENMGIAYALNVAAKKAYAIGYRYLLTMDQDSILADGAVLRLYEALENGKGRIAVAGPIWGKNASKSTVEYVDALITSGSLVDLEIYNKIGPFREDYFIDYVDYEYCCRARVAGYQIVQCNDVRLTHHLGNATQHNLLGVKFTSTNHSVLRRYYMTRNRFHLCKKYGRYCHQFRNNEMLSFWYQLVVILLVEKDRCSKLQMILRGYLDYRRGRLGKYKSNL